MTTAKRLSVSLLLAAATGAAYWAVGLRHLAHGSAELGPHAQLLLAPAPSVTEFYGFVAALLLWPILFIFVPPHHRAGFGRRIGAGALALCLASSYLGYVYESLSVSVRLTGTLIEYRAGGETASIKWSSVRGMALHWRSRGQSLEVSGIRTTMTIDLGPFTMSDRAILIEEVPKLARLPRPVRRSAEEWVWARSGRERAVP